MTKRLTPLLLSATLACSAVAQDLVPVPRARILPDLVKRADDTHRKLSRPNASYGCRELFTAMLAYAAAQTNLTRVAELLTVAEGMQNRDPEIGRASCRERV